jgi:hypothetical protein
MQASTERRSSCSAEICFAGAPSCVCFARDFSQGSALKFNTFRRAMFSSPFFTVACFTATGAKDRNEKLFFVFKAAFLLRLGNATRCVS